MDNVSGEEKHVGKTPLSAAQPAADGSVPQWNSADLFQGSQEVHILHRQERYRLVLTRAGKLLLQK